MSPARAEETRAALGVTPTDARSSTLPLPTSSPAVRPFLSVRSEAVESDSGSRRWLRRPGGVVRENSEHVKSAKRRDEPRSCSRHRPQARQPARQNDRHKAKPIAMANRVNAASPSGSKQFTAPAPDRRHPGITIRESPPAPPNEPLKLLQVAEAGFPGIIGGSERGQDRSSPKPHGLQCSASSVTLAKGNARDPAVGRRRRSRRRRPRGRWSSASPAT